MAKLYDKMVEATSDPAPESLYDTPVAPLKKYDSNLPAALQDMNRSISTPPQEKLDNPLQYILKNPAPEPLKVVQQDPINPFSNPGVQWRSPLDIDKFRDDTLQKESGGDYGAKSKVSSAVGGYQFLWGTWGDSIKRVTGVKDEEAFRKNPSAQNQFFNFYTNKVIAPEVNRLSPLAKKYNLTDTDLAKMIHFQGAAGAQRALEGNTLNSKQKHGNPTINQYLGH